MNVSSIERELLGIPKSPGVYLLHLGLTLQLILRVGKLGEYCYQPGEYLYVGSALGPGGLKARLGRHLLGNGRRHWHIDWLRPFTSVNGYFYLETTEHLECAWSQFLIQNLEASIPAPGFGASDCRSKANYCTAHLFRLEQSLDVNKIRSSLPKNNESKVEYRKITSQF